MAKDRVMPLVSVRNVTKRLGAHQALAGVSLDVTNGEAVAVVGPSGSGKTTLLRLIAGLDTPDSGEIWLNGAQVSMAKRLVVAPHERRIGFVFQDLALWPHLTVEQQLEFVLGSAGVARATRPSMIRDCLAMMRIDRLARRYPHELSGGEQQRAALARALVGQPRLLLLDEPFSSLDAELRVDLRGELARVQRAQRLTTVYVTHDLADASGLANRIVGMGEGRIVSEREN